MDNPEQKTVTIHMSIPECLLVFKASRGDELEQIEGTIHAPNQEHLLVAFVISGPMRGLKIYFTCREQHSDGYCDSLTDPA